MRSNSRGFVSYLEKKYPDDNFKFIDFVGGTLFGGSVLKEARCTSELLPDYNIFVSYNKNKKSFSDNYLDMKYLDETDEAIKEFFNIAFQNEEFYVEPSIDSFVSTTASSSLDSNIGFDDYKRQRGIPVFAYATNNSQKTHNEISENIKRVLTEKKLYCDYIDVYILDELPNNLENDTSLQNSIVTKNKYSDHLFMELSEDFEFETVEWENE